MKPLEKDSVLTEEILSFEQFIEVLLDDIKSGKCKNAYEAIDNYSKKQERKPKNK